MKVFINPGHAPDASGSPSASSGRLLILLALLTVVLKTVAGCMCSSIRTCLRCSLRRLSSVTERMR
mgnify:CR=1 FL=1